ncbi:MAG TPA: serine hydrolase domain-containing protein, partial [Candidatus Acidoferrum sp.]|nr:serine hydrolase domain-containing protein [Candidatus Acidoferrum sp.]
MTTAHPGFDAARLQHLRETIHHDITTAKYFGAVVLVARHGEIALQEAFGFSHGDHQHKLQLNSVFSLFSLTKAFTTVLTLRAIELGQFALTTRVVEVIPEFRGGMREKINFLHLLTHTSGLPMLWIPKPGMFIDRLDEIIAAICDNVRAVDP